MSRIALETNIPSSVSSGLGQSVEILLPEQLLARVAEQLLRLRIHQQDAALPAHDHHRVRRRLQQTPELHLGPFSLGDFPIDLENPGRGTLRIPLQSPPAGHDNARAVALAMDQFALPAPFPQ